MPNGNLRIGQVAAAAGVRVDTVRYYERRGLLPRPGRSPSGYRLFAPTAIDRIRFARRAQALGLRLSEIADVLRARDRGDGSCAAATPSVTGALARIDGEIARLRAVRRRLVRSVRGCTPARCALARNRA
ncbi:MAG TPA: MerR family transcriptional regulator [Candidatus Binatia bacterium]|nr:MerR family transcriptional regulator [Candidatus Binatia bacterium]